MEENSFVLSELKDFTTICRACLNPGDLKPFVEADVLSIYKKITDIEIKLEDMLPKNVCIACIKHLEDIKCYVEKCKNSEASLKNTLIKEEQAKDENATFNSCVDIDFSNDFNSTFQNDSEYSEDSHQEKIKEEHEDLREPTPSLQKNRLISKISTKQRRGKKKKSDTKKVKKKRVEECSCNICGKKFAGQGGLKRHLKIHEGIKPFECDICGKRFVEKATLNRHNLTHTEKKPFDCNLCGKTSNRRDQIIDHINKHHPNAVDCDFAITITEHKLSEEERSILKKETVPEYQKLNNSEEMKHNDIYDNDDIVKGSTENTNSDFEFDMSNIKEERKFKTKKRVEICLCNLCGKVFRRRGYLKNHMAIHAQVKPFICKICGKGFTQRHALTRHDLVHTKERPFQCNLCGKTFTRKEILTEHIKNHEAGKKPYLCFHCGKSFSNKDYLNKHLKYYSYRDTKKEKSEDKKCICPHCGKQLHSMSYMKTHLLTHTGEKPFVCNICGNRFTVQRSLNHHLNIHRGIKPYQCQQCQKAFRTSSSLNKHNLLHAGERPFKCTSCEKGFIRRSHLKRHLRSH